MAHTLSIIIPVYNTSAFLEKCVESVLKQNVEMEIILIDDGSTDDSPALCDRLALCDARIKVIHQANSGISSARNRALDICKGKYITFVDSDDELLEDTYKPNLEILEQNEHITVFNSHIFIRTINPIPAKGQILHKCGNVNVTSWKPACLQKSITPYGIKYSAGPCLPNSAFQKAPFLKILILSLTWQKESVVYIHPA